MLSVPIPMIMTPTHRKILEIACLFCLSLLAFTWGLSQQEIIGFDSRFFLFAQEMTVKGASWFPTTYYQPYPDYPVTSTFLIDVIARLLGGLNKFIAVLPSAIAAAITVVVTYLIGALRSKRFGLYAVIFLLFTISFFKGARSIALDMYPTMVTACCFYLVYSAEVLKQDKRKYWIYPLLILGFLFRGPIGLVIPTGVICMYYLLDKKFRQFFLVGCIAFLLLFFSTTLLLFAAYQTGGTDFLKQVLLMEVVGRINNSFLPPYFYFTDSLGNYALSFPCAALMFLGLAYYTFIKKVASADTAFLWKLVGWVMVILLGMSIPGDKKIRYVLPMVPAVALLAAYPFVAPLNEKYYAFLRNLWQKIFFITPTVLCIGVFAVAYYAKHHELKVVIFYWQIGLLLMAFQAWMVWLVYRKKNIEVRSLGIALLATLSFISTILWVDEPLELHVDKARLFVQSVEELRVKQQAQLIFYREKPDGLPIKYLINMPQQTLPVFIDNSKELLAYDKPAFIVASESYFAELPKAEADKFKVIAKDKMGHIAVVVFSLKS